jgi:hypothetical protein
MKCGSGGSKGAGKHYSLFGVRCLTYFFLLLTDVVSLDAGRLVFLPFTHGPRGVVLSWSTINAFAAASLGVSTKRLMECAMPLLHSLLSELLIQRYELLFRKTTEGSRSAKKSKAFLSTS